MKLRRSRPAPAALGPSGAVQPHALTSPTNVTSWLAPGPARSMPPSPRPPPPSLAALDAQVAEFRSEVRFSSTTPVAQWIRLADRLKRQADQHHSANDLEHQYVCLAKCAKLLLELLPQEHTGWSKLDDESRAHVMQTAETIRSMVQLTRESILEARQEQETPSTPVVSPSSKGRSPGRSSLRQMTPEGQGTPSKRVSFADTSPTDSLTSFRPKLPWHRESAPPDTAPDAIWEAVKPASRRTPWAPRLATKQSMSFLGPVVKASPPPAPPSAPDPPRWTRRRPRAERRFLTADPVVSLSVADPETLADAPASPVAPLEGAPADTPMRVHPALLQPAQGGPTAHERRTLDVCASAGPAPLRPVHVPHSLPATFLECAQAQLAADEETCGWLLGRADAALCVTHLVLPPQSGTPYSCQADGEAQVLAYQMEHNLLTLGWIHTHPSQTSFLSSLDLHTQASYQALLPEAIAVVCAPKHHPSLGVYRLTQPEGLHHVLHCTDEAPFHPHTEAIPLYTDTHVHWDRAAQITVVDLRGT